MMNYQSLIDESVNDEIELLLDGDIEEHYEAYMDSTYVPIQPTNGTADHTMNMWRVALFLHNYYTPLVAVIGSIGNVLSIVVFFHTKLRKLSSSYYLAALGVSDTIFLLINFLSWLPYGGELQANNFACKLTTFLGGASSVLSAWMVVAFTIERFIAVLYPLRRQTMCTVRRAKFIILGLFIAGLIDSSPLLYFFADSSGMCYFTPEVEAEFMYYNYWDTLVSFVLPLIIIVVLNSFTAYTVWKVARVRRNMTYKRRYSQDVRERRNHNALQKTSNDGIVDTTIDQSMVITRCTHLNGNHNVKQSCPKPIRQKLANSSQMKVTKMLLIVSTVFVLLNLPDYDLRIQGFLVEKYTDKEMSQIVWQHITHSIFLTNYGINFVLYCITGQNFRKELFAMFKRQSRKRTDCGTQVTVAEFLPNNSQHKRTVSPTPSWNDGYELQTIHTTIPNR